MNVKTLLQDADPLRHELPRLDAARERIKAAMLRELEADRSAPPLLLRRTLMAGVVIAALAMLAVGYQLWRVGATPVYAAVGFELRLAEENPQSGLIVAQVADSDRLIYLHPGVLASNEDIVDAAVAQAGPDAFTVRVELTPSAAERMREATTMHLGRPIAVLLDGRVELAPVVRSPIGASAEISGDYTQAEAERIADGIRIRAR